MRFDHHNFLFVLVNCLVGIFFLSRCGSVIVDLALKFSSALRESEVLSILQDAVKNGKFGDLNVTAYTCTRDRGIPATPATTPTPTSSYVA